MVLAGGTRGAGAAPAEHDPPHPTDLLRKDVRRAGRQNLADLREIEQQVGRINDRVVCQPLEPVFNVVLQISLCLVGKQRLRLTM